MDIKEAHINRNVRIILSFNKYRKTMSVRDAFEATAKEFNVSSHLVNGVMYKEDYPYAAEAHAIVNDSK